MFHLPSLILTTILTTLFHLTAAQEWPYYKESPTPASWKLRYDPNGTPTSVILTDNMHGLNSPLRARITALFGALDLNTTDFAAVDQKQGEILRSDLYKVLDETLPDLNGTRVWAEIMQERASSPSARYFGPLFHSSLMSLGFVWTSFNEAFAFEPPSVPINCPCGMPSMDCSPRSVGAQGGPPYTIRHQLKAMLDAIVAVLQDKPMMQRLEKWTFNNPWLEQDQRLMRVAGLPPWAASDLRGVLVMGQYSVYQLLHRFSSDCPVPNVECGPRAANTCTVWIE